MWFRYFVIFGTIIACSYAQLVLAPQSFLLAIAPALILGWCCALVNGGGKEEHANMDFRLA